MLDTILIALGAFAVLYVLYDWLKYSRMPGIGRTYWPVVGHFPYVMGDMDLTGLFVDAFTRADYPAWMFFKVGVLDRPKFFTIDPKNIEHFMKTKFEGYELSRGDRGEAVGDFLGDGIFNSDGHKWLLQRKLASREFSANRFKFFMSEVFNRAAAKLSDVIAKDAAAAPAGKRGVVDMHKWFFVLTLDAFSEIAFGLDLGGLDGKPQPFIAAFDKCQQQCFERCVQYSMIWHVMKAVNFGPEGDMTAAIKTIDDFVYGLMDKLLSGIRDTKSGAQSEQDEDDLLRRLLPAAKRDDGSYDRKLVRDMLLNLIIAGRDTTAASMSWTLYELTRHPDVLRKVLEELDAVVGPKAPVTFDAVADCTYLQAVLSEAQRLHPSVPFQPKTAVAHDVLPCGVHVKPGDTVAYVNVIMGVNPKIWGADAAEFKPSRWLAADGHTYVKADQFKYPAFNAGRRLCLGMDMANLEMKVVLGTLLRRFDFELVPGQDVRPATALTLQMRNPLNCYVTEKKR
jgi:cytochrome P450